MCPEIWSMTRTTTQVVVRMQTVWPWSLQGLALLPQTVNNGDTPGKEGWWLFGQKPCFQNLYLLLKDPHKEADMSQGKAHVLMLGYLKLFIVFSQRFANVLTSLLCLLSPFSSCFISCHENISINTKPVVLPHSVHIHCVWSTEYILKPLALHWENVTVWPEFTLLAILLVTSSSRVGQSLPFDPQI